MIIHTILITKDLTFQVTEDICGIIIIKSFLFGLGYYPYYYSLWLGNPYWYWRYNSIWNYGYYGITMVTILWGNNYSNWNNYTGSIVKYRNNVNTELEITTVNAVEQ